MAGYLFVYFIGEEKDGEQVYFSVSNDGLHWHDLNDGRPVLYSETGTCGIRDPFPVRNPLNGMYYLIATDLCIYAGKGWEAAQEHGSRDLIVWESKDLIHWKKERAVTVGLPEAGCVWAPEAVFDEEKQEFLVFFASKTKKEGEKKGKHRIYAVYTKDFRTFSDPFLYMERERDVIDTTILKSGGSYYRISKDETTGRLLLETSASLCGEYCPIPSPVLETLEGVEGPEGYLLPDKKTWCVIADQFAAGKGYRPMLTDNLAKGEFRVLEKDLQESGSSYDMGGTKKRHGGVLTLTDAEYEQLVHFFDRKNPVVEGLYADPELYYEDGIWYLYPTADGFPEWSGTEFFVFTSADGKQFKKAARLLDVASEQVPWAEGSAWAPCITKRNGRYYFYFCAKDITGKSCIGAAVADSPTGPFTAMETPLVTMELMEKNNIAMHQTIDPSIYIEEKGAWLCFGNGYPAVGKLSEDMLHIEEHTLQNIEGLKDFCESLVVFRRTNRYHFTWSCGDTRSEDYRVNYGISDSLLGPVTFIGTILQKDVRRGILGTGHQSILNIPGEGYYMAYHRFGTPLEQYPEGKGWKREICVAPLEFDAEDRICPVLVR